MIAHKQSVSLAERNTPQWMAAEWLSGRCMDLSLVRDLAQLIVPGTEPAPEIEREAARFWCREVLDRVEAQMKDGAKLSPYALTAYNIYVQSMRDIERSEHFWARDIHRYWL